jgi:hypothetical protein
MVMIDLNDPLSVMYLPVFDGGRPEGGGRRVSVERAGQGRSGASNPPSTTTQGFSYPGPQTIISDVPEPTNRFQTLLQPGLENPPILEPPLLIPNIVQVADAGAAPKMEEPPEETVPEESPKPEPKPPEPAPKPVEQPKPTPLPPEPPKPEPKPPEPAPKPVEQPKPTPLPPEPPKPEPKPPEPAPKPVEQPKPTTLPPEPPKPEPKPAELSKPEPKSPKIEPKQAESQAVKQAAVPAKPVQQSEGPKAVDQAEGGQPKEQLDYPSTPGASRDILSLSPMPAAPGQTAAIPAGESRGRFVISPQANLYGSDAEPGLKTGVPAAEIGIGNTTGAPARKGIASKTAPITPGKNGSGIGSGGGSGRGTGNGGPSGTGSGSGSGSGSGPGAGSSKKPFAGITIVGGDYEPGTDSDTPPVTKPVRPLQTAYGLNIISTEDSGGGLPFYGVFSHEQIYTVYLDMRTVEEDQDPSWTIEFAVNQDTSSTPAIQNLSRSQQGLVLPFPAFKEKPVWPPALVHKYPGRMIVVFAVITAAGKVEQISIKESPDALLNEPVIRALSKWVFRPAQTGGQPVSAKMLMGIPLWVSGQK